MALGFFKKKKDDPETVSGDEAGGAADGADSGQDAGAVRPEPDKARRFFERAQTVHDTGNYEYAMTLWLQGLRMDPTSLAGLESFMKSGGDFLNAAKKSRGPTKDQIAAVSSKSPVEKYLRALLEWGARPLEWPYALKAMDAAARLGLNEPAYWIGERALGLAGQDPKVKKDAFVQMLNLFEKVGGIDRAVVAGDLACRLDPTDGPLIARVRNLSAQAAMNKGGYEKTGQAGGFRENVKNLDAQREREEEERLVKSEDVQDRNIERAKADYTSRPTDDAAITKLARFLLERAKPEDEKLAYQILVKGFETNQNYRFKMQAGDIKLRVGRRKLRALKAELDKTPDDTARQEQYSRAARQLLDEEIKEYEERVLAYPTDLNLRLELGKRCLEVGEYEKAIEQFQHARGAPQMLNKALMGLAQAFERLGWLDEAESTYREAVERHENPNDELGAELRYGLMATLERKARENSDLPAAEEAFKLASSIAMQRIGFRDIRDRRTALQELAKSLKEQAR